MTATASRRWWALALLSVVQFMVVLDIAIVNVALPSIGTALDFSRDNLQWVITAYAITYGGFLLLAGRLADRARASRAETQALREERDEDPDRPGERP